MFYTGKIYIYIILSIWSQNVNSMLLLFFWTGVDLSKHLHCKQTHSKICPALFQLCFSEEVRLSLFAPKTVRVFCQNIFMTYFSRVSITNSRHRQYEEFWREHFTSEHFAFSCHLFAVRLVRKGLYWLTPSDWWLEWLSFFSLDGRLFFRQPPKPLHFHSAERLFYSPSQGQRDMMPPLFL